jgi:hypothetical protein
LDAEIIILLVIQEAFQNFEKLGFPTKKLEASRRV